MIITKDYNSSSSSAIYTVTFDDKTQEISCGCKGWTFKRGTAPRSCKHTKEFLKDNGVSGKSTTQIIIDELPIKIIIDELPAKTPEVEVGYSPMLASAMPAGSNIETYMTKSYRMEEKFDGHRILVTVSKGSVVAMSRPGTERAASERKLPQHLVTDLLKLPDGVYDGELLIPGGTSTDVVRLDRQTELVYGVFDVLEVTGKKVTNLSYLKRREQLEEVFWISGFDDNSSVYMAESLEVSADTVQKIWDNGGEGAIVKHIDSTYECGKRSTSWIKIKRQESATFKITGFKAGKLGSHSIVELKDDAGNTTTLKVLNNDILADITKNPALYIGRTLVVSHMGRAANGGIKHGVWDHIL